ncbi:interleukin-2 receptor subunit beta-like [Leucoraja erinacea]|uniref:interleukin-2 receptor subunit beta-like n=1 Tax=Leucoraja erinaceus TaxID=7782 RepID=UPI0024544DD1|nr:interleukin-2 receptor subunit beta-like [Leucoraja erinacea]
MGGIILIIFTASIWPTNLGYKCENKDLKCAVDYVSEVTCCWSQNVSLSNSCQVWVDNLRPNTNPYPVTCAPVNGLKQGRRCSLNVPFFSASQAFNITLLCTRNGLTTAVASIPEFIPAENIQLQPLKNLTVVNNTDTMTVLSWQTDYDIRLSDCIEYEIRYKLENDPWKTAQTHQVQQKEHRLQIDSTNVKPDAIYMAQIRAITKDPQGFYGGTWSKWSKAAKWKTKKSQASAVQQENSVLSISLSLAGILLVVAVLVIMQFASKRSRLKALYGLPIPDPSKFFHELNSTYGGNFQRWLGTRFPASFSSTDDLATEISSVEISELKDTQSCEQNVAWDSSGFRSTGDSSTSSFANQGYFLFDCSKASDAYPCKIYFSNKPASRREGSEGSRSYRCLTSSDDSLYDSSFSPDSPTGNEGFDLDGEDPGPHDAGETSEEEIDGPPREHGSPAGLPHPGNPASQVNPSKETNCPFEGLFQFPSSSFFGPHLSLAGMEDERAHRLASDGLTFDKAPTDTPSSQDPLAQQCPGVYKTKSLNLAVETDPYLSLKQVHSKYNSQSI